MFKNGSDSGILYEAGNADGIIEVRRQEALLKTGALQNAILTSANFSIIATDEKGIIQLFNVGAERMLGYTAAEVMDKITPADISDPQEVIVRAKALSLELGTPITPGFEALVFKAALLEFMSQADEVPEATPETVQSPDDQRIAIA